MNLIEQGRFSCPLQVGVALGMEKVPCNRKALLQQLQIKFAV